jgi:hypothetical protein
VAVEWYCRMRLALASVVQAPVTGSHRSAAVAAWSRSTRPETAALVSPPVARTDPSARIVALDWRRRVLSEPLPVIDGTDPVVVSRITDVLVGTLVRPSSLRLPPPVIRVLPMSKLAKLP